MGWLDARVLKKLLVYDYTPENIIAQIEVQELLDNDGVEEDDDPTGGDLQADLNQLLTNAISVRGSELKEKRQTDGQSFIRKFRASVMKASVLEGSKKHNTATAIQKRRTSVQDQQLNPLLDNSEGIS